MNLEEKYAFLTNIQESDDETIDEDQCDILEQLSNDRSSWVRGEVATTLSWIEDDLSKDLLFKLARDKDEQVRTDAVGSLCDVYEPDVYEVLKEALKDPYYLVRGYAVDSMVSVGKVIGVEHNEMTQTINHVLEKERSLFVKLNCYKALYELGHQEYLDSMFSIFRSKNYNTRCAAINVLGRQLSADNQAQIKIFLLRVARTEPAYAVLWSIGKLLDRIDEDYSTELAEGGEAGSTKRSLSERLNLIRHHRNDRELELGDDEFAVASELASDEVAWIRSEVAALLMCYATPVSRELLLKLAQDKDSDTRAQAYRSLSRFRTKEIKFFLQHAFEHERDVFARTYIIASLAEIDFSLAEDPKAQLGAIKKAQTHARTPLEKAAYYYWRYLFGDADVLDTWLSYLDHTKNIVRWFVVSSMDSVINKDNADKIIQAVNHRLTKERSGNVKYIAKEFLKDYHEAAAKSPDAISKLGVREYAYLVEADDSAT